MKPRLYIPPFWIKVGLVVIALILFTLILKPKDEVKLETMDSLGMGTSAHLRVGVDGLPGAYQQLEDMHIHWVREEIPWSEVEQGPGQYQWYYGYGETYRDFNSMLAEAKKHNLNILAVLNTGPVYLPHQYPDQSVDPDQLIQRWQAYVQAVVDRYGSQINHWEIGSEMNNPIQWGKMMFPTQSGAMSSPAPFLYSRMLSTAHDIIKKHNPNDQILISGLYGSSTNDCKTSPYWFLNEIKKAGAWDDFDVIALHPYWQNNPPEAWMPRGPALDVETGDCLPDSEVQSNLLGEVRKIQALARETSNKPVWITELGWREDWLSLLSTNQDFNTDQVEANFLVRSIVPLISEEGIRKVFWASQYEDPTNPGFVLGPNGQQTLSNLGRLLGGARPLGQMQLYSDTGTPQDIGLYEYRFRKEGRIILFAWAASGGNTPYPITFEDLPGRKYRAYASNAVDLSLKSGMELTVKPDNSLTIYINEQPVILIQENPSIFASLKFRISDGFSNWWSNQQDELNLYLGNQMEKLGDQALNWSERAFFKLINWVADRAASKL
jgi:hypothetical protein